MKMPLISSPEFWQLLVWRGCAAGSTGPCYLKTAPGSPLERLAHRGEIALLAARQRLPAAEQAEHHAALGNDRQRLQHAECHLVLRAGARHDRDPAAGLH